MPTKHVRAHTFTHRGAYVQTPSPPPSNNSQFDRGSRNARALISPGVFSSTGSRPWIATIRLVQRRRAVGNSGFWGNRWKHPRPGFEIRYRTLREYKPAGVRGWRRRRRLPLRRLSTRSLRIPFANNLPTPHVRPRQPFINGASTVFETLLRLPNPRQRQFRLPLISRLLDGIPRDTRVRAHTIRMPANTNARINHVEIIHTTVA